MAKTIAEAIARFNETVAAASERLRQDLERLGLDGAQLALLGAKESGKGYDYPEAFEAIWEEWRARKGPGVKHDAFKAWSRVGKPGQDVVRRTFASWWQTKQWRDGIIPHLSSFFSRRQWETPPIVAGPPGTPGGAPARPRQEFAPPAGERQRVEQSWREAWAKEFPGQQFPGLFQAQAAIMKKGA